MPDTIGEKEPTIKRKTLPGPRNTHNLRLLWKVAVFVFGGFSSVHAIVNGNVSLSYIFVYFCVMRSGHYFFLVGWGRGTVEN
jgi:hypothetical protein